MDEKDNIGPGDGGYGEGDIRGSVTVVGIGPGGLEHMTAAATKALLDADVVVGYTRYVELISAVIEGKETFTSGMTAEVERCERAVELAREGANVVVVSSGDAGIYGMAGLVHQIAAQSGNGAQGVRVDVVPGVPAFVAASSILGAPLMHDFASISLSDLLTPWELIEKRLIAAASADFVIVLYNPKSRKRVEGLGRAIEIIRGHRADDTPAGIVRNATREGESVIVTTLGDINGHFDAIDMLTIVLVGNSSTTVTTSGAMVTPRGYRGVD